MNKYVEDEYKARLAAMKERDAVHKPWHYPDDSCCDRVWNALDGDA